MSARARRRQGSRRSARPRRITAYTATGRLTGVYERAYYTPLRDRAVTSVRHHGGKRMAGILFLSSILVELRGAGPGGSIWEKLNRLDDEAIGALIAAVADDRRRVLDLRLGRLRDRAGSISAEWLHELERRVDAVDDE